MSNSRATIQIPPRSPRSRERVLLMEAAKQIHPSLHCLRTQRLDRMQFHEAIRFEDPDRIFTAAGEDPVEAQDLLKRAS
jgi:hypothetical protein